MANTKIEWCDKVWNVVTGCTKVSAGCKNCYAEVMHKRLTAMGQKKYAEPFNNIVCHEDGLEQPMHWKKPQRIFVNSMSDLFHEDVPFEFIEKVFAVMAFCSWHTFMILTKRPKRMLEFFNTKYREHFIEGQLQKLLDEHLGQKEENLEVSFYFNQYKNIWLGVSIENKKNLWRLELLKQTTYSIRFLSLEPLLEDLGKIDLTGIHWVIVGGESGKNARHIPNADCVRNIRDQCKEQNVSFLLKQWGEYAPNWLNDNNGNKIENSEWMDRFGKKEAGRKLDAKEYNEFPEMKK